MRLLALAAWFCWSTTFEHDVLGTGSATHYSAGYAEQDALHNAKNDAIRQCMERKDRRLYFRIEEVISNTCERDRSGDTTCTARVCGYCSDVEP